MIAQHGSRAAHDGHAPPCSYRTPFWIAAPVATFSLAALAVSSLAERPGDWLLAIARAPGFATNPNIAHAVAGADWLAPSIQGGTLVDAIGAAIAAITVMALIAIRVRQRFCTVSREDVDDPVSVYKIVTNQTKADDNRVIAWHGWTPSPACERVKTMMCG
ncbi:MAG: hypothetical protein ACRDJH_20770 [Thermomicrobiales bacterium]